MKSKPNTHPSYGTVLFTRTHCGGGRRRLFGSSILNHFTTVKLTIHEAERYHRLYEDKIWGRKEIIGIELSAAQFAELLTTMNVGTGVPCTIRWRESVGRVEDPPDDEIEIDRVKHSFNQSLIEMLEWLRLRRDEVRTRLEGSRLPKRDQEYTLAIIDKVIQQVESNQPFTVDQFNEATERIVSAAKAEVDSFVTQVVQATGMEQLRAMKGDDVIEAKALTDGDHES